MVKLADEPMRYDFTSEHVNQSYTCLTSAFGDNENHRWLVLIRLQLDALDDIERQIIGRIGDAHWLPLIL